MEKVFTEIGIGNPTFINTEVEEADGSEHRQKGTVSMRIQSVYIRWWVGYRHYSIGYKRGFKQKLKNRKAFKLLLGIEGLAKCK